MKWNKVYSLEGTVQFNQGDFFLEQLSDNSQYSLWKPLT